ncbi:uncharacterized protein [Choristoneura fumiferana]|uniref:uncharacterized protein n=1 Tax=Choristoneura fumiferana TaxID=7141 RepID=UPI003D156770
MQALRLACLRAVTLAACKEISYKFPVFCFNASCGTARARRHSILVRDKMLHHQHHRLQPPRQQPARHERTQHGDETSVPPSGVATGGLDGAVPRGPRAQGAPRTLTYKL